MALSVEMKNMSNESGIEVRRKQSDDDSGLEFDEKNTDLNNKLLLLSAENSNLLSKVDELKMEKHYLMNELQNKSQIVTTGNLMISTLTIILRQREFSYQELFAKYKSFCELVGNVNPDTWTIDLIKSLIPKVTANDESDDSSEEIDRLKYLVGLLEESLYKMNRTLEQEANWKIEVESEIKKLHRELNYVISVNNNLRDKIDWYELKIASIEKNLHKRMRNNEQLKACLNELQIKNEELITKLNEKKHKGIKPQIESSSIQDSLHHTNSIRNPCINQPALSQNMDMGPNSEIEYSKIKTMLKDEENQSRHLKFELDRVNNELLKVTKRNKELEKKVKNVSLLKKKIVKLAMKHRHTVDIKNENMAMLREIITQLKVFLKFFGSDFVERITDSKWILSRTFSDHFLQSQNLNEEFLSSESDVDSLISENFDKEVKFEKVSLQDLASSESTVEEVD